MVHNQVIQRFPRIILRTQLTIHSQWLVLHTLHLMGTASLVLTADTSIATETSSAILRTPPITALKVLSWTRILDVRSRISAIWPRHRLEEYWCLRISSSKHREIILLQTQLHHLRALWMPQEMETWQSVSLGTPPAISLSSTQIAKILHLTSQPIKQMRALFPQPWP